MTAGKFKLSHYHRRVAGKNKVAAWEGYRWSGSVPVLEPEGRTEGYFKVIMCAVIEVNLVASLKTQAKRTQNPSTPAPGYKAKRVSPV